ncbi:MAG: hypothetical protein V2B18_10170 [Pseudomonadota bacterium]
MQTPFEDSDLNPFDLFSSSSVYKVAVMYFSRTRGLAIVGRLTGTGFVEVIQISGEVDPHTGNFTALDYPSCEKPQGFPVVTRSAFDNLVAFIAAKVDDQTPMSIIEPQLVRSIMSGSGNILQEPGPHVH